jgi:VWFA-related protein
VAVTDKSGKPVAGLQQNDFTLLDNKQPQRIVSFRAEEKGAAPDAPVEVVLVADEINTGYLNLVADRDEIEKFLRRDGGELALPVSMVFLSDTVTSIGRASSRDGNALAASLDAHKFGLRAVGSAQGLFGDAERRELSLRALDQLLNYEATRPGRKLVVWIGPGWPLFAGSTVTPSWKGQQAIFGSVVACSDSLRRARTTLYDVNPRGNWQDTMEKVAYERFLTGLRTAKQAQFGSLGLQVLAYQSGGRSFDSSGDLAGLIATCVMDGTDSYALSFDGLPGAGPNEYHELELKTSTRDLTVRAPSGYYAQPEHASAR